MPTLIANARLTRALLLKSWRAIYPDFTDEQHLGQSRSAKARQLPKNP
jgi:hypothetical protein